jgi:hypothetical protein
MRGVIGDQLGSIVPRGVARWFGAIRPPRIGTTGFTNHERGSADCSSPRSRARSGSQQAQTRSGDQGVASSWAPEFLLLPCC